MSDKDKGLETFATVEFDTDGYPYCEFTVDPVDLLKSDEIQKGHELVTKESALLAVEAEREAYEQILHTAHDYLFQNGLVTEAMEIDTFLVSRK